MSRELDERLALVVGWDFRTNGRIKLWISPETEERDDGPHHVIEAECPEFSSDLTAALSLRHALREKGVSLSWDAGKAGEHFIIGTFRDLKLCKLVNLPADATDEQIAHAIATVAAQVLCDQGEGGR